MYGQDLAGRGGRNWFQEEQRQHTRTRILAAADEAFATIAYAEVRVEDLLSRACVSRACFYSHFEGKLATLVALLDTFAPALERCYTRLFTVDPSDIAAVETWLGSLVDVFASRRGISSALAQAMLMEADFLADLARRRRAIVDLLGQHIPAFAVLDEIRAAVMLHQVDQFACAAALGHWEPGTAAATRFVAEQLQAFLRNDIDRSVS